MKGSPYPIRELREFLLPFRSFFYRYESFQTLERVATGLMAELERKSGAGLAARYRGILGKRAMAKSR